MRFIQDQIIKETKDETWFNENGKEISGENEKFYAKRVVKNGCQSYYIRVKDGLLFDPLGMHSNRQGFSNVEMRRVSKNTFDFYMMYLSTNNNLYLTRAQRGFIND